MKIDTRAIFFFCVVREDLSRASSRKKEENNYFGFGLQFAVYACEMMADGAEDYLLTIDGRCLISWVW